ncbi:MAG: D-sedoheptulose 7-phosphate isomerase [Candidatus Omnitrophica bacterium]|nr:D-sedoheptulose 7-phosphate isomerase [Candidatus Omnitrophota bacterium]MBU2044466.1 D-sedoheptulose 7-phosphate isomerase [Candidatus Omnitrophota bacterium]MBU2265945.1 D-sedoheptulose 7-phosphate isomerase [Candidatus Omnitrophota bacterium]MBU2474096.1 D-sedoheptulose 7-phosphate isomerase [Candidatus Omnitrophota bacterium]
MDKIIASALNGHRQATEIIEANSQLIEKIAGIFITTLKKKGKLVFIGNGGSAADAQHLAAEFIGRFKLNRIPLAALALTTNTSTITAVANDFSFEDIFLRQIQALVNPADCLVGISTSGKSKNIVLAVEKARQIGAKTVGFLGQDGGDLAGKVDLALTIPIADTPRIQEMHILAGHIICEIVENEFF